MIIGIGTDIVEIERIQRVISAKGQRFLDRIFDPLEQAQAQTRARPDAYYAKRFAAKEACSKALGTGLAKRVQWRDIVVTNSPGGKPVVTLHGAALEHLMSLVPAHKTPVIDISLADEVSYAQAFVIISIV